MIDESAIDVSVPAPQPRVPPVQRRQLAFGRELALTRICIAVTVVLTLAGAWSLVGWLATPDGRGDWRLLGAQAVFVASGAMLLYGSLVYQVARLGYLHRIRAFRPVDVAELAHVYDDPAPRLAVLVPSYREDPELVRMTLMSAALQSFPRHQVILLIDDPPNPTDPDDVAALDAVQRLPAALQEELDRPAAHFAQAQHNFAASQPAALDAAVETRRLAGLWDDAAAWFEEQAARCTGADHVEAFFRREILEAPAAQHRATAAHLRWRAELAPLDHDELRHQYCRLAGLFAVDLYRFERKRYANLSHAPNKAMNLNSYLQLLGGTYRVHRDADGDLLVLDPDGPLEVPDADYVITLDADSMLLPDYAIRLVHVMTRPGNEHVGLVQTPYSAYPGAPDELERIAGATTDVMCLVHQGSTHYGATYWVGANALLRTAALRDIAEHDLERGHVITRYIRDRTLTEDTDSTIDLRSHGWELVNHPARLAYSATPTDFGSLLIQRRRWANGGLLILPRFLRRIWAEPRRRRWLTGLALRLSYLTSLASVNVAFLILMAYSFDGIHAPVWLPLLAVPYFGLYARDLAQSGYRASDVVRVYALTLLLIPVHLGGVVKSVQQAWTRRQVPFARTPTMAARTPIPALYVIATLALLAHWASVTFDDLGSDRNARAIFTAFNVGLLAYAVTSFMGWRPVIGDLWLRATGWAGSWATVPHAARRAARPPLARRPVAMLGLVAMVPVLLVTGVTAMAFLRMRNVPVESLSAAPFPRMNVLVVGSDSREGLSAEQRAALSLGSFDGARADTLFLLSVEGDRAALLAFPRDLYVERCDGSRGRINEALEIGGPSCVVEAVEDVSGVPISNYVQLDVTGLVDVVNAVGGVDMTLDAPIVDDKAGANLRRGGQRLGGDDALAYVRVREIDDDLGRIDRQQEFLHALAAQLASRDLVLDPLASTRVVSAAAGALTVDQDTGPVDLARVGFGMARAAEQERLAAAVVPTDLATIGGEELLVHDAAASQPLFEAFADGSALHEPPGRVERLASR